MKQALLAVSLGTTVKETLCQMEPARMRRGAAGGGL